MSKLLDALFDTGPEQKDEFFDDCAAQELINDPTKFVKVSKARLDDLNGVLAASPYRDPKVLVQYMCGGPRNQIARRERRENPDGTVSIIETYADGHTEEKREGIRL